MSRAPFQVLVFPFRAFADGVYEYALFRRSDDNSWQGIAGGGQDDESPIDAARREAREEAGIPINAHLILLDSICSIPVVHFGDGSLWPDRYVIPEHSFGVACADHPIVLSPEHIEFGWFQYDRASEALRWESNRTALWELDRRLREEGRGTGKKLAVDWEKAREAFPNAGH